MQIVIICILNTKYKYITWRVFKKIEIQNTITVLEMYLKYKILSIMYLKY